MLTEDRKKEIYQQVVQVYSESDKYQLVHALSAIEKIIKYRIIEEGQKELSKIREKLKKETDNDVILNLLKEAERVRKDNAQKTVKITVDYTKHIEEGNARTLKANSNTYRIHLPESMANFIGNDKKVDTIKFNKLRHLMAHELGHILLHSPLFEEGCIMTYNPIMEEEADYFANELIELRKESAKEIYSETL